MKKTLIFGLVFLFLISVVSARFPDVHTYNVEQMCADSTSSSIKDIICSNIDACIACDNLDDISVVYYFTEFERYDATHSPSFCKRLQEIATSKREMACAYCACQHQIQDSVGSHNSLIPWSIEATSLANSIIHPLIEQKENDYYVSKDKNLEARTRTYLESAREFAPLFKKALQQESSYNNVNIDKLIDFYVTQVQGSSGYDMGIQAMFAVPVSLYIILILIFFVFLFAIVKLATLKNKTIFNKITIAMLVIPIVLLLILFGSVFIGGTYNVFKAVSKPINFFVPTPNWEDINTATLSAERSFLSQGNSYLNQLSNPTGMCESASKCTGKIPSAEAQTAPLRVMFTILLAILLGFLVWLNVKKKGKV